MSVAVRTMDELTECPPGARVQVGNVEWERVEGGLKHPSQFVLKLEHFSGYVAGGLVQTALQWEVGRWYRNGSSWRYLTGLVDDRVHAVGFGPNNNYEPLFPTWSASARRGAWALVHSEAEDAWMKRIRTLYAAVSEQVPEPFVRALHRYAVEVDDVEFDELLANHGVARTLDHVSMVTITGHSFWTPDQSAAQTWLGDDTWTVTDIEDAVTVYWRRVVPITINGVGCTCEAIDRTKVEEYVPAESEEFEFSVECGDDVQLN